MSSINIKLGIRLRQLRKRSSMTQEEVAERAGISEKHLQRLESNKPCDIRLATLNQIAKAFKISVTDLLKL